MSVINMQQRYTEIVQQWYGMPPDELEAEGIADPFYSRGVVDYEDVPESIWNREFFEAEGVLPIDESFDLVMASPGKVIKFPDWLRKSAVI